MNDLEEKEALRFQEKIKEKKTEFAIRRASFSREYRATISSYKTERILLVRFRIPYV